MKFQFERKGKRKFNILPGEIQKIREEAKQKKQDPDAAEEEFMQRINMANARSGEHFEEGGHLSL